MMRRLPMLALAVSVGLGSSIVGCASLFVATDGLSGGAEALGDGGDASVEATALDAAADVATLPDGSLPDGATPGFCASNPGHTFCDDFDDRTDVTVGWETDQGGRCVGSADVVHFKSAPRSVRVDTPAGPSAISYAHIGRSFGATTRVRASFDIFITPPSGNVGDSLGTVSFPQGYFDMGWYTSGDLRLTERTNKPNVDHLAAVKLKSGQWVRILIEYTPGHIFLSLDGVVALDEASGVDFQGVPSLFLGLYSEDVYAIAANYDNVLVDTSF